LTLAESYTAFGSIWGGILPAPAGKIGGLGVGFGVGVGGHGAGAGRVPGVLPGAGGGGGGGGGGAGQLPNKRKPHPKCPSLSTLLRGLFNTYA